MRTSRLLVLPALLIATGCASAAHIGAAPAGDTGLGSSPPSASPNTGPTTSPKTGPTTTSPSRANAAPVAATHPGMCATNGLSVRLDGMTGAAGSVYMNLVFRNVTSHSCTLFGYPGVAYVAPRTGHQVGAAADRNPAHPAVTVTVAPGASAVAILRLGNPANYPPADCNAVSVSGVRVYPPGNTVAAYVPFADTRTACSTQVHQLAVEAVQR